MKTNNINGYEKAVLKNIVLRNIAIASGITVLDIIIFERGYKSLMLKKNNQDYIDN